MQAHDTTIRNYLAANQMFYHDRGEINISIVMTFLAVALYGFKETDIEPMTIQDLADKIGIPVTTVQRHLRYLSETQRQGKEGMRLIDMAVWPLNRRMRTFKLSREGRALVERLRHVLEKG